ncbi:Sec1 family domain-containing protein MIP3 [Zea mays]|uniref:Sec1 family domain-containing protein MIP3 n=1 Tax=Zea mays TaxID=4577 RepID=A0A1D6KRG1_MAIZE|nr:Sec1 family domain-containing protein MIP3 [Zea mays]
MLLVHLRAADRWERVAAAADWQSSFSNPPRKIIVLISRLLSDAHRYILRCLSNHGTVSHCAVLTAISKVLNPCKSMMTLNHLGNLMQIGHSAYVDSPLGPDAFREYETLLIQDHDELLKKSENLDRHKESIHKEASDFTSDVDNYSKWGSGVHYGSNSESSPTKRDFFMTKWARVFVLPSEGIIADSSLSNHHEDSLGSGLPSISTGKPFDSDEMDIKLDIFSLGDTSKVIGKLMMDMKS